VPTLCHLAEHVLRRQLTAESPAAQHSAGGIRRQRTDELRGVLTALGQSDKPPPGQGDGLRHGLLLVVVWEEAEIDPSVQLDARQHHQEAGAE
jgi:hypothetical protein